MTILPVVVVVDQSMTIQLLAAEAGLSMTILHQVVEADQ